MNSRSCFHSGTALVLMAFLAPAIPCAAQNVIAAPRATVLLQTPNEPVVAGATPSTRASNIESALASDLALYRFGPFGLRPHGSYRVLHGTGIEAAPGLQVDTTTQTVAPGVVVEIGEHWLADYTPSWTYYSNRAFTDSVDHAATLVGGYEYDSWRFRLAGGYTAMHPMLVETARQTKETRYDGNVEAHGQIATRTFLDLGAGQSYSKATPTTPAPEWLPSNTHEWSASVALRYAVTERTQAGFGVAFGHDDPSIGPATSFVRPELHLSWTPTERIAISATAGAEERRFHGGTAGTLRAPTYGINARYHPVATTTLLAGAMRSVALSYQANRMAKDDGWNVGLEQRLFGMLYGSLGYSERTTRYVDTAADLPTLRRDRYESFDARIAVAVLKRGTAALFYQRSRNRSSLDGFTFTSNQIGAEISFKF